MGSINIGAPRIIETMRIFILIGCLLIARAIEPGFGVDDDALIWVMLFAFAWDVFDFLIRLRNSK